jgi:hypothetical protein
LAFIGFSRTLSQPIENAAIQIDKGPPDTLIRRRRHDGIRPRAAVDGKQDEAGEVTERALSGFPKLAFVIAAMQFLHFAVTPTSPNQLGYLVACQPPIPGFPFIRKGDPDNATMQTLLRVKPNSCPKVFQIPPGATGIATPSHIVPTRFARDRCEFSAAPELVQAKDAAFEFCFAGLVVDRVVEVNRQDVSHID